MNERIRELSEQAEIKEVGYYFFDKEKFAELIVRECAKVSENYACGAMPLSIALAIEKHFGVKR